MIELLNTGAYLVNGIDIIPDTEEGRAELKARTGAVPCPADAAKETIAYGILKDHNVSGNMENLQIKFDKLTSHDITFVGIIQTARVRTGKIPGTVRADQLPQLPLRSRRNHQRR